MPAAWKASFQELNLFRSTPAISVANPAPCWWLAKIQQNIRLARAGPKAWAVSFTVGRAMAIQSRP
jgi:hypothetical protein